ncbi:MAG: hypothetical protein HY688_04370 [Chloroflexi bacterium]|nr:hypothetical protein [Chloroflexota bacterium]
MITLAFQYALFVCVAACGVIQVSATRAGLHGLMILPGRRAATLLGCALIGGAFLWFFGLVDRNTRGLEGLEQTLLFVPSALCAVAITVVVSSVAHQRRAGRQLRPPRPPWGHRRQPQGLEALRETSYLDALLQEGERAAR